MAVRSDQRAVRRKPVGVDMQLRERNVRARVPGWQHRMIAEHRDAREPPLGERAGIVSRVKEHALGESGDGGAHYRAGMIGAPGAHAT